MKKQIFWVFLFVFMAGHVELSAKTGSDKILVVFFSWSGNAKALAGQIAQATGGDLFEIKPVAAYPDNYDGCVALARQEKEKNARPAFSGGVVDIAQYKTVFLCYPNWCGTMPMIVFTFLESYDFSDKTIYPLVTHGSSRFGSSIDDMQKLCPRAVIGEGLSVSASSRNPSKPIVSVPNNDVNSWLGKIGVKKI